MIGGDPYASFYSHPIQYIKRQSLLQRLVSSIKTSRDARFNTVRQEYALQDSGSRPNGLEVLNHSIILSIRFLKPSSLHKIVSVINDRYKD